MKQLQTTIRIIVWGGLAITGLILADLIGRHLIEILP